MTKLDIVSMYLFLITLTDMGFSVEELMTSDEKYRFNIVMEKNEFDEDCEQIILMEAFNNLLIKAGIRYGALPEYIN